MQLGPREVQGVDQRSEHLSNNLMRLGSFARSVPHVLETDGNILGKAYLEILKALAPQGHAKSVDGSNRDIRLFSDLRLSEKCDVFQISQNEIRNALFAFGECPVQASELGNYVNYSGH